MFDICIVGSGPSAVISAQVFIEKGYKVCLIDVSNECKHKIPFKHFKEQLNPEANFFYPPDNNQSSTQSGNAQITKAREHLITHVNSCLQIESSNFAAFQALAAGGLSAAWGAACFTYRDDDLEKTSIGPLQSHYEAVAKIIGISGPKHSYFCNIKNKQKPATIDHNGESLLHQHQNAFVIEPSSMALLTEPLSGRNLNPYFDMDFYSNFGDSVFRGDCLLKTLEQNPDFTRIRSALVTAFEETHNLVKVKYLDLVTSTTGQVVAAQLVICAGALNSYRLVANSLKIFETPNPILCNPYLNIPTVHLPNLGKKGAYFRHSLSQVFGEFYNNPDITLQFYSYRSLLLSRLIEQTPMPPFFARLFWRALSESLVIVGAHFADDGKSPRSIQALQNEQTSLPTLKIDFSHPQLLGIFKLIRDLLKLRCVPMGIVKTKMGASIHYAGTIPISHEAQYPIGMNAQGRIHNTKNVYVFDSSGWTYLPSRGLTFTIMANAHRLSEALQRRNS